MDRLIRIVDLEEWALSDDLGDRKERLQEEIDPIDLIERLSQEAMQESKEGRSSLCWQQSIDCPGTARLVAQFTLSEITFDQLFNGRCGYRAQYYLSPDEGIFFNRDLVLKLLEPIKIASSFASLGVDFPTIEKSLLSPHSKVWIYGEKEAFDTSKENLINPPRWVSNGATRGRKSPLPEHLKIDLKGTFIDPESSSMFLDELKIDRALDLYNKGYT